jgi:electron transfer flavoprotein alpha subunit
VAAMEGAVWVVVEHEGGQEKPVAHELLSEARKVADSLRRELHAIVLCREPGDLGKRLTGHPDRVVFLQSPFLAEYSADGYTAALHSAWQQRKPTLILSSSSLRAMDFMPKLACRLDTGMVSEATALSVTEGGSIRVRRPTYGGRFYLEVEPNRSPPWIVAARPRAFARTDGDRQAEIEMVAVGIQDSDIRARTMERVSRQGAAMDLTEASVVVTGGRGMKGPEHFGLLGKLADLLGGAVGASRAVVDSKWRPPDEQVGKSGRVVSPSLYMAFGVSGAVHHIMGMDTSKFVVAVNNDPKALIFNYADYGIVDDLFQILPELIKAIRSAK